VYFRGTPTRKSAIQQVENLRYKAGKSNLAMRAIPVEFLLKA